MDWKELKNNFRIRDIFETRIKILKLTREFFWNLDFKEVDTPIAIKLPGQEPYLHPVPVKFHNPIGDEYNFYLQTSPEFAMKKILSAGYNNIFQVCKCFRDYEQFGGNHNIEFMMIEWYRSPGELANIMDDMESFFKFLSEKLNYHDPKINSVWDRISMKDLWQKEVGINLDENLTLASLSKTATNLGFKVDAGDEYEDVFYKIFLNKIETKLGTKKPIFITDFPAQMCSLSKSCVNDNRYAQRFEAYIDGIELANGFGELTNAKRQQELLELDRKKRQELGQEIYDVDSDFISALENLDTLASANKSGVAGVALGLDRVIKLFSQARDLNEVIFEAVNDQIN